MFEVAAGLVERLLAVDEQMRHGALGPDELEQPFGNPGRQIQHRLSDTMRFASSWKASSTPSPVLALVRRIAHPALSSASTGSVGDVPALLQIGLVEQEQEGNGADFRRRPAPGSSARLSRVSARVPSATRRYPAAPRR